MFHLTDCVDIDNTYQEVSLYTSKIEVEKSFIQRLMTRAAVQGESAAVTDYLARCEQEAEHHLAVFRDSLVQAKVLSERLDDFLREMDPTESIESEEGFDVAGAMFYPWYEDGIFSFWTWMGYDSYAQKERCAVFKYEINQGRWITRGRSIGFLVSSEKPMKSPFARVEETLRRMEEARTCEEVETGYQQAKNQLCLIFGIDSKYDLAGMNIPYFNVFFGEPEEWLRRLLSTRRNRIQKLKLQENGVTEVLDSLHELLEIENALQNIDEYKEFFEDTDKFEAFKQKKVHKKKSLMDELRLNQETLDLYLEYVK